MEVCGAIGKFIRSAISRDVDRVAVDILAAVDVQAFHRVIDAVDAKIRHFRLREENQSQWNVFRG